MDEIVRQLRLGALIKPAERVSGGFMHRMYRVQTDRGKYAVKLLNPVIMRRPDVFDNYRVAEALERKLQANGLPVVPALEFGGAKMQCIGGQYLYVFDWTDGRALGPAEITKAHCGIIGALLAKIHKIERREEHAEKEGLSIDWDRYIGLAADSAPGIAGLLKDNRELFYSIQDEGNAALRFLPDVLTICDGDMDSKNVLWIGMEPKIIDLECLGYSNPRADLFELALCWSGYPRCRIDFELLKAFMTAYRHEYGEFQVDWEVLYRTKFCELEWLEYNIKRALTLGGENEEEQKLGVSQVEETIEQIRYYRAVKNELLGQLATI